MGRACASCNGTGFGSVGDGGYEDTGLPCRSCNESTAPREPGSFAPKPEPKSTVSYVDGDPGPGAAPTGAAGSPAEAFFPPVQIAAQRAVDARAERR